MARPGPLEAHKGTDLGHLAGGEAKPDTVTLLEADYGEGKEVITIVCMGRKGRWKKMGKKEVRGGDKKCMVRKGE